ncbi:hypothetical protein B0H14DRAFT_2672085, partial [Mycena olivaceomarginata]
SAMPRLEAFPFTPHHSTDDPLYAVADSAGLPPPSLPSLEEPIVTERISSRADSASGFFRALCQTYRPPSPPEFVDDSEAEDAPAVDPPEFPVNWTGEPEELPSEASPRKLWKRSGWIQTIFGFLLEPLLPKEESRKPLVPEVEQPEPLLKAEPEPLAEKYQGGVLKKAIYTPHGKWAWAAGLPFTESGPALLLSSGIMCSAFLKTGHILDRPVQLVSKIWLTKEKWHGFFSELALYKVQLKPLQGRVVPAIINVYSCTGAVDVAMEPPHHSFWIEASPDMPHVLKKRCVKAFEQLHAAGVLHGDVELRHMLIGGDARVTIIDFQASRALEPNAAVGLVAATPDELRMEMRKVKFKLDYEDARAREDDKLMRAARLARRNQRDEEPLPEDVRDPPVDSRVWNLEWISAPVEPTRFIMPGQSEEDVMTAVEEFLTILERLEEEEEKTRGDTATTRRRRASPDFKPPTVVPAKSSSTPSVGKGFGATVVPPATRGSATRRPSPDSKSRVVLPPQSLGKATSVTPTTLKRKSGCDRPQEDRKRIRFDASPSISRSPPPAYEEHPPTITRLSPTQPRQSQLTPPRAAALRLDPSPPSSAKRKRDPDAYDESLETRGRPKMRISFSCDASDPRLSVVVPDTPDVH